jgi:hypothetical protein
MVLPLASLASALNRTVSPIDVNVHVPGVISTEATFAGPAGLSQLVPSRTTLAIRPTLSANQPRPGLGIEILVAMQPLSRRVL